MYVAWHFLSDNQVVIHEQYVGKTLEGCSDAHLRQNQLFLHFLPRSSPKAFCQAAAFLRGLTPC